MEEEKIGGNLGKTIKNKETSDRVTSIRDNVLQTARTSVAEIRKDAIPFSYGVIQTWPTSFPDNDVIEVHNADDSLTGP